MDGTDLRNHLTVFPGFQMTHRGCRDKFICKNISCWGLQLVACIGSNNERYIWWKIKTKEEKERERSRKEIGKLPHSQPGRTVTRVTDKESPLGGSLQRSKWKWWRWWGWPFFLCISLNTIYFSSGSTQSPYWLFLLGTLLALVGACYFSIGVTYWLALKSQCTYMAKQHLFRI